MASANWEYLTEDLASLGSEHARKRLAELGQASWEAVAVHDQAGNAVVLFKRPLLQPEQAQRRIT